MRLYIKELLMTEILKTKRTFIRHASWIVPLVVAILFALIFAYAPIPKGKVPDSINPWFIIIKGSFGLFSFLFFPFFAVLVSTFMVHIEHKSETNRFIFMQPLPRGSFFLAKLAGSLMLIAFSTICLDVFILISGVIFGIFKSGSGFLGHWPDFWSMFKDSMILTYSAFAIVALHTWFSFKSSNFLIPLLIGFAGLITSYALMSNNLGTYYIPYAYSALMAVDGVRPGGAKLDSYAWLFNGIIFVAFTVFGYINVSRAQVKE